MAEEELALWGTMRHRKLWPLRGLANELYCCDKCLGQIKHGAILVYQIAINILRSGFVDLNPECISVEFTHQGPWTREIWNLLPQWLVFYHSSVPVPKASLGKTVR